MQSLYSLMGDGSYLYYNELINRKNVILCVPFTLGMNPSHLKVYKRLTELFLFLKLVAQHICADNYNLFNYHFAYMQACADKLKWEMETFGFPPQFPAEQSVEPEEKADDPKLPTDKAKGKKVIYIIYLSLLNQKKM